MPIIMMYAQDEWLPAYPPSDESLLTDEAHFTKWLIDVLPPIMAGAMHAVDGSNVTQGEVVVVPIRVHPWATPNMSDIWLDIQPEDRGSTEEMRRLRRVQIRAHVHRELKRFVARVNDLPLRPSMDIEVRPLSASGYTIDRNCRIELSWGDIKTEFRMCKRCGAELTYEEARVGINCVRCMDG